MSLTHITIGELHVHGDERALRELIGKVDDMAQSIADILLKIDAVDQKVEAVKLIVLGAQQQDLTPIGDRLDQTNSNLQAIINTGTL